MVQSKSKQTIDGLCPESYRANPEYQGCPYCAGQLIKEMVEPFQRQGYYRCSYCNSILTMATIIEMRRD